MVYTVERNKQKMVEKIDNLHNQYSKFSRPQILRVSQVQIISNKRLRRIVSKADKDRKIPVHSTYSVITRTAWDFT